MADYENSSTVAEQLIDILSVHPRARIVTDVGRSMFSGWGDLKNVAYHAEENAIELEFD